VRISKECRNTGCRVSQGVAKLDAKQKCFFTAVGVPTLKPQELAEPTSVAVL
jgi:hypothetical protein